MTDATYGWYKVFKRFRFLIHERLTTSTVRLQKGIFIPLYSNVHHYEFTTLFSGDSTFCECLHQSYVISYVGDIGCTIHFFAYKGMRPIDDMSIGQVDKLRDSYIATQIAACKWGSFEGQITKNKQSYQYGLNNVQ